MYFLGRADSLISVENHVRCQKFGKNGYPSTSQRLPDYH